MVTVKSNECRLRVENEKKATVLLSLESIINSSVYFQMASAKIMTFPLASTLLCALNMLHMENIIPAQQMH